MRIPMATHGNDGAFPSSIQMRNTYQKWYETPDSIGLRRTSKFANIGTHAKPPPPDRLTSLIFTSKIIDEKQCAFSSIKLDLWRDTLRRFHLDVMRIPMATHGNDGAFPSSIQMRNTYQKWYKTPD